MQNRQIVMTLEVELSMFLKPGMISSLKEK